MKTNGRYYLVCNYDKYDYLSNYRLDRITHIKLLDTPIKPKSKVKGMENGLDLPKHMAEHIYMFSGESVPVKFRAKRTIAGDIIDWFGMNALFSNEMAGEVDVYVTVNETAMFYWLLQYGAYVEVLEPSSLRQRVRETVKEMSQKYTDE